MADIVIRGREMPKSCLDCPIMVDRYDADVCALQSEEANEAFESWEDMRRNCPLVPLPAGHGRLIDADALMNNIGDVPYKGSVRRVLLSAHTIVPAVGGGENG